MSKYARIFLSLMLLASFSACSTSDEEKSEEAKEQEKQEQKAIEAAKAVETYKVKQICPQVAIVRDLATLSDYGVEKPDPSQLVAVARMDGIEGDCGYQDDGIDIKFKLKFAAARGPRLGGDREEFPFFVAVVDPEQKILNKDQMTEVFEFGSDNKVKNHDEQLHIFIPLTKEQKAAGSNYRVLVGFQLSETQLKDVRAQAATRK